MNFEKLLAKMAELDQPVGEAQIQECPPMDMAPPAPVTPSTTPPSLSVNLNAQGLDNIEEILKLITKVNPDSAPKEPGMPSLTTTPSIASIAPEIPPLKMLPDFDAVDGDKMNQGDDEVSVAQGDLDNDGDHDMDDHDMEKNKEEEYENEPDVDVKDSDFMLNKLAGGMNGPKGTYPKVAGGDNPMQKKQFESGDLRAQIRAELLQRLAEAKGEK